MVKRILNWSILIGLILIVSYFNRWIFAFKYEPEYWEDYYNASQWSVPNSKRVISDEGVYRYIGYRLVNGENPFNLDYWVPPMGKYWYGVGAKYFQNPYLTTYAFYLLSILAIGLLAKLIFKKNNIQWLIVYFWVLNPLIVEQLGWTMLDLPMTLFFLLHIYFLFRFGNEKSTKMLILAGIFLGLMAGTKPAYFVPMIGLVDWWWILLNTQKNNKIKNLLLYLFFVFGGYILAYTCYFIAHPNPIPWLRLHEKVINFQKSNGGSSDVLNIFKTIFLGKYKGYWVGGTTMTVTSWSIVLPLGTILLFKNILFIKKTIKQNPQIAYLTMVGMGFILMCLTIDFWPRYLVPLIPILIILIANAFNKKPWILILLLIAYLPWLKYNFFPTPKIVTEKWNETVKAQQYRDTYRLLNKDTQQKIDENTWLKYWEKNKDDNLQKEPVLENNQWRFKLNLPL